MLRSNVKRAIQIILLVVFFALFIVSLEWRDYKNGLKDIFNVLVKITTARSSGDDFKFVPYGKIEVDKDAPLDQANMSYSSLATWTSVAVEEIMTFDFSNHDDHFNQMSLRYFTKDGWNSFDQYLKKALVLKIVEKDKMFVKAANDGAARVVTGSHGKVSNNYEWVVQIPVVLTYSNDTNTRSERLIVTLVIMRSSENDSGVRITQWLALSR